MQQTPNFNSIQRPQMVGLFVGNGVGSKLLQGYLDGVPELYMIPAYPLMYFYPHWNDWKMKYGAELTWLRAINLFCEKHASVIDSRRIPGFNGLQNLGKNRDEYIGIDEAVFKKTLCDLIQGEPVKSSTLLLAAHYAYALCHGQDISRKHVLIYHVHARQYLNDLLADFPDAKVIAMTRDSRSNFDRRIVTCYKVDAAKLNRSDTYLFRALPTYHMTRYMLQDNQIIASAVRPENIRVIRHEDMGLRLEPTLKSLCDWIGLVYTSTMLEITFGGKEWWGDEVYDMAPTNQFNQRVLSKDWQKSKGYIDWYVQEGLMVDFFKKYGYRAEKYTNDSIAHRLLLVLLVLFPTKSEWSLVGFYLNPINFLAFIEASFREAYGELPIKDYTWNATYLYKWMYIDLHLWKIRLHVRLFENLMNYRSKCRLPALRSGVQFTAMVVYVGGQIARYFYAVLRLPYWFFKLRKVMFERINEMWRGAARLPDLLIRLT